MRYVSTGKPFAVDATDYLSMPNMMPGKASNITVNLDLDFGQSKDGHQYLRFVSLSAIAIDHHETYNRPQKGIEMHHKKEICTLRATSNLRT